MKNNNLYIKHIIDSCDRVTEYINGIDYETFKLKNLVIDAVIRQLQIIGEAAKKVSDEMKNSHAEISWKDMAGMRDKLIHDYFGVDIEAVYLTATKDVPKLREMLGKIKL
ncbi:MAG: DUF86 domain-containing protein [Candidatus Goldbacteria bacterium]|nr:DUF86 domain-containing protein [Candidatus Goldiibacteriota bacterium]